MVEWLALLLHFYKLPPPLPWLDSSSGPRPPHYRGFTITLRHTTLGRTRLDEGSARPRDLYLTTHNTDKRQTDRHPYPRRALNPQFQQASGRRPTSYTERPPGSAFIRSRAQISARRPAIVSEVFCSFSVSPCEWSTTLS